LTPPVVAIVGGGASASLAAIHLLRRASRQAQEAASKRVFSLGPLRRAELWETIAVPDIRVQAAELAEVLVDELCLG
jgi:uncharacterized NAD(P)/FAD-binding protein YdhS